MPPIQTQFKTEAQTGSGMSRPQALKSRQYMQSQSGQMPCLSAAGFNICHTRKWCAVPERSAAPRQTLIELTPIGGTSGVPADPSAWGGFTDRLGQFSCRPTAYASWDAPYSDRTHGCPEARPSQSGGKAKDALDMAKPQTADSQLSKSCTTRDGVSIFARYSTVLIRRLHAKLKKVVDVRFESDWNRVARMMDKSGDQRLNVTELTELCFGLFEVGHEEFPLEVVSRLFSLLDPRSAHRRRKDSRIEIAKFVEFIALPPHRIGDFLELGAQDVCWRLCSAASSPASRQPNQMPLRPAVVSRRSRPWLPLSLPFAQPGIPAALKRPVPSFGRRASAVAATPSRSGGRVHATCAYNVRHMYLCAWQVAPRWAESGRLADSADYLLLLGSTPATGRLHR